MTVANLSLCPVNTGVQAGWVWAICSSHGGYLGFPNATPKSMTDDYCYAGNCVAIPPPPFMQNSGSFIITSGADPISIASFFDHCNPN